MILVAAGLPHAVQSQSEMHRVQTNPERRPQLITEATYAVRVTGRSDGITSFGGPARANATASIGFVTAIAGRFGIGVVGTAGLDSEFFLSVGPRLRWDATPIVSVDVTPQYLVGKSGPGPSRLALDVAVMHRDRIGASLRVGTFRHVINANGPGEFEYGEIDRTAIFAGLRLGRKPGRFAILADAVALVGVIGLYVVACNAGSGCD
ncbi:MAG: hypothetical protein ABIR59_13650 [Gemmatimonadales bacterium]